MDTPELEKLNNYGLNDMKQNGVKDDENSDTECGEAGWMTSEKVDLDKERGVWANKLEFFLAIMGYTIGIGSVWRFPIICR